MNELTNQLHVQLLERNSRGGSRAQYLVPPWDPEVTFAHSIQLPNQDQYDIIRFISCHFISVSLTTLVHSFILGPIYLANLEIANISGSTTKPLPARRIKDAPYLDLIRPACKIDKTDLLHAIIYKIQCTKQVQLVFHNYRAQHNH